MTRLVLATRNASKLAELRRILAPMVDLEVIGLDGVPDYPEVPETGATFAQNALIKAREAAARTGLLAVADDSGLAVDALNGMPGVLSARWAGPWAVSPSGGKLPDADAANLRLVLAQLADVPDARLGAAFVCAAALVTPESLTAGGCRAAWGGSRARDARAENRAPGASAASGGSGASDAADAPDALPAWGGVGAGETVAEARMPGRLVRAPRGANGFGYDPIFVPDGHARTNAELSAAEKDAISHRGQALRALAPAIQDALRRT